MGNGRDQVDELAASPRRWEQAETTLRVVEPVPDEGLGTVYGELERGAQLLARERTRLEKLLAPREPLP